MNQWIFKASEITGLNEARLTELSPEQEKHIPDYKRALVIASRSMVPDPIFSKYFVRGSIGTAGKTMFPAGNIEYGLCAALHCEETAVAVQRVTSGKNISGVPILGFCSKGESESPPTCCGNCRDVLLDTFGPELEIVAGKPNGGIAVVTKLAYLLASDFAVYAATDKEYWSHFLSHIVAQTDGLICDPYAPVDVHPERRYSACIETEQELYLGARDIMCDYHPIYAGRDACRQAIRDSNPFIQRVIIVCEDPDRRRKMPHVMYKDRQHLLETNLQAELLQGHEQDPPVLLFNYYRKTRTKNRAVVITGAWRTSVKKWLPFPFTAGNFGPEFVEFLTKYYRNRQDLFSKRAVPQ